MAATFYRAITGQAPPEALDRLDQDELMAPTGLGIAMAPGQEAALLKGLAVKAGQRYREMVALQQGLQAKAPRPARPVSVPLVPALSRELVTGKPAADASDPTPWNSSKSNRQPLPPLRAISTWSWAAAFCCCSAMVSIPVWNDATSTTAPVKGTSAAPTLANQGRPAPATRVTPTPPPAPSPAGGGPLPPLLRRRFSAAGRSRPKRPCVTNSWSLDPKSN